VREIIKVTAPDGRELTLKQIEHETGIPYSRLHTRYRAGYSWEDLTKPGYFKPVPKIEKRNRIESELEIDGEWTMEKELRARFALVQGNKG
jgi:hypothetical protein